MCYCVDVSTLCFHLDLLGKRIYVYVAKWFFFPLTAHGFHIVEKWQNLNHQFPCDHQGNREHEKLSEKLFNKPFLTS